MINDKFIIYLVEYCLQNVISYELLFRFLDQYSILANCLHLLHDFFIFVFPLKIYNCTKLDRCYYLSSYMVYITVLITDFAISLISWNLQKCTGVARHLLCLFQDIFCFLSLFIVWVGCVIESFCYSLDGVDVQEFVLLIVLIHIPTYSDSTTAILIIKSFHVIQQSSCVGGIALNIGRARAFVRLAIVSSSWIGVLCLITAFL